MEENRTLEMQLGSEETEFKREIGLFGGVSILGGIMIGGGIFYLGSYVLMRVGYSLGWALAAWVIGGLICLLGGLCFAELGAMIPKAGGMNIYLNIAYHPLVGFMCGFQSWLIGSPGSLSAGALALCAMFSLEGTVGKIVATVILLAFTIFNLYGVKGGTILQNVTLIAKLVPIAIIMFGALFMGKVTPNLSFTPMDGPVDAGKLFGMIAFAAAATLWAYEGWTNLNSVAEEIHNPKKNLPLALIIATGGITVLYTLFNFSIYRVLDLQTIRSLIEGGELYLGTVVSKQLFGAAGGILVTVGMAISSLGSVNGMTLAFARVPYSMAHEGHFFPGLGKLNKYKVPANALWCQFAISTALIWIRSLDQLTNLVVFGGQIFNCLVIAAVLVLRKKMPNMERPYRVWGGVVTVIITLAVNLATMINTAIEDPVTAVSGLAIPVIAAVVYFIFDKKLKKEGKKS